jgi:hypothetical protein
MNTHDDKPINTFGEGEEVASLELNLMAEHTAAARGLRFTNAVPHVSAEVARPGDWTATYSVTAGQAWAYRLTDAARALRVPGPVRTVSPAELRAEFRDGLLPTYGESAARAKLNADLIEYAYRDTGGVEK